MLETSDGLCWLASKTSDGLLAVERGRLAPDGGDVGFGEGLGALGAESELVWVVRVEVVVTVPVV